MKASPLQLHRFLQKQDTQFVIPIYQRNYDWSEEQCKQLLEDILEVGESSKDKPLVHFIGSIVYVCNDEYTTDEVDQFVIIDGQQRLTTITLLLIALYHYAKNTGNSRLQETIYEYYLVNKNAEDDCFKIKLKATENNEHDLLHLLEYDSVSDTYYSNINNNYNFFFKQLSEDNWEAIYEGFRRLLFVEIRLERGKDNAQKIFESLNSTGLDLSQADLIRNYILMDLEPQEQESLYRNYWSKIETNTKIDGESYMSDFIRDFLTIQRGEISNKNKVYATFKQQYQLKNASELNDVLKQILTYSEIYSKLIKPDTIEDEDIRREVSYIKYIEINVSYPFLLQIFNDFQEHKIDKDLLLRILMFIQSYVCRRFILDLPTNALNKIFMNLYKQIDLDDYENSLYSFIMTRTGKVRMPSDAEIKKSLGVKDVYNARSKMKSYLLERLENFKNKEFVSIIDNAKITIEHIFPQTPDPQWRFVMDKIEFEAFSSNYIHTIGNLTLSGNNGALGNKSFLEKKTMNKNGDEQGYIFSRLWLNRYLRSIDVWNVQNYKKRTKMLVDRFIEIWSLPEYVVEHDVSEQNVCEMDLNSITGKDIEYLIFFGKKLSSDDFGSGIDLYEYIIKEMFGMSSKEDFIRKYKSILKLTKDPITLRRYKPLNSTYFYNTNLSYLSIFTNLKKILKDMDISDELFVKLRDRSN